MALLKKTRGGQYPLLAEFVFNFNDTMVDVSGVTQDFGSVAIKTNVDYLVIPLPSGATVIGGELIVDTAFVGPTAATLSVGDSASATRYASAVSILAAARTALTLTGFRGAGEDIRIRLNTTVAVATAGKVTVRVLYTVQNRQNENQIS